MHSSPEANAVSANRLCLGFVNLPFTSGDPRLHQTSWAQLIDFLANSAVISLERSRELQDLTQSDPQAAETLLRHAVRLGDALRAIFEAMIAGRSVKPDWVETVNGILGVTEDSDQLQWDQGSRSWKLGFRARHEGLEWLLAAVARSGAELIAEGNGSGLARCDNSHCRLLFYDNSKTHRRRWCSMALCGNRSKVAAFARRHAEGKARAQHA